MNILIVNFYSTTVSKIDETFECSKNESQRKRKRKCQHSKCMPKIMCIHLYILWINFFHRNLFNTTFGHVMREHRIKVWDCRGQYNTMSGEWLIFHLRKKNRKWKKDHQLLRFTFTETLQITPYTQWYGNSYTTIYNRLSTQKNLMVLSRLPVTKIIHIFSSDECTKCLPPLFITHAHKQTKTRTKKCVFCNPFIKYSYLECDITQFSLSSNLFHQRKTLNM